MQLPTPQICRHIYVDITPVYWNNTTCLPSVFKQPLVADSDRAKEITRNLQSLVYSCKYGVSAPRESARATLRTSLLHLFQQTGSTRSI